MYSCEKLARGTGSRFVRRDEMEDRRRFDMPVNVKTEKRSYFGNASVYSVNFEEYEQRPRGSVYRSKK
jgi:hypothetical protein